jgi:hypothetical protein
MRKPVIEFFAIGPGRSCYHLMEMLAHNCPFHSGTLKGASQKNQGNAPG